MINHGYEIEYDASKDVFIIKYNIGPENAVYTVKNDADKDKNFLIFSTMFSNKARAQYRKVDS